MRNRAKQHERRREKHHEEKIERKNSYGAKDLTCYNAVRQIQTNEKADIVLR